MLHFPADISRSTSAAELVPQLLRRLVQDSVSAVQFLRNGKVRLTLKTIEYRNELLRESSFLYGEVSVPVTASVVPIRSVYVRDLPFEVSDVDVHSVFESYGVVHSVRPVYFRDFPSVATGTRVLLMSFAESVQSIPSSLSVSSFPVRVWHAGQPVFCSICRETGHLPQACPFSGRCLRCKQPGHKARDCKLAGGPSRPSLPVSSAPQVPVPVSTVPVPVLSSAAPVMSVSAPIMSSSSKDSTVLVPSSAAPVPSSCLVSAPIASPSGSSVSVSTLIMSPSVSPASSDVEEGEIVMSSSPLQPVQKFSRPFLKRKDLSSDVKYLVSCVLGRMKLGDNQRVVRNLANEIIESYKLHISEDDLRNVIDSVC